LPAATPRYGKAGLSVCLSMCLSVGVSVALSALSALTAPPLAVAAGGGAGVPLRQPPPAPIAPGDGGSAPAPPARGAYATLSPDGRTAVPPARAPEAVKQAIYAANRITRRPYVYGGGHRSFRSRGYDCSGAVSYALNGGGMLYQPLDSHGFMRWGAAGPGAWITVYANRGHAYVVIAGLRFDTSGQGEKGPRWRLEARSSTSYRVRHPLGF
jgi:hypothetical protein